MSKQQTNFSLAFATTKNRNNAYIKLSDYFPTYNKVLKAPFYFFVRAHARTLLISLFTSVVGHHLIPIE